MKAIIALLSGSVGPWVLIGAALACLAAGATGGYVSRGVIDAPVISDLKAKVAEADGRTQQCKATHEAARADGAEKVIKAMDQAVANAAEAINVLAQKAAARGKTLDQFLKEIANAPPSKVCGTVAAELAYRRSVSGGVRPPAVPATTP